MTGEIVMTGESSAELTSMAAQLFAKAVRTNSSAASRALVRLAVANGMTFEMWRQHYVRDMPPTLEDTFKRLDAAGVDVEAILLAMYDEMRREAVN